MIRLKLFALAALSATAGFANTLILDATGLPPTFMSGNYGSSGATYNGFVTATINGIPNQFIICDDYSHDTQVPSGNMVYDFSAGTDLANVRFNQGPMAQNYHQAAVLLWELFDFESVHSPSNSANANTITDYQYALWNIFDPAVNINAAQLNLQTSALDLVNNQGAMLTANVYPHVAIYTPDPQGGSTGSQEFLQYVGPEPGTLALLACALLLGTAVAARREWRKRRTAE